MKYKYIVKFKSSDINLIKIIIKFWSAVAKEKNILIGGPIFFPLKRSKFTLLRSPHVYNTSRERFEVRTYTCAFVIYEKKNKGESHDADVRQFLDATIKLQVPGLSLKITKKY